MFSDDIRSQLHADLEAMRDGGTFKAERIITSPQGAEIVVGRADTPVGQNGGDGRADTPVGQNGGDGRADTPVSQLQADKSVSPTILNFCANNYLGLGDHPALIAAAKAGLDSHGYGMSSVRFICG